MISAVISALMIALGFSGVNNVKTAKALGVYDVPTEILVPSSYLEYVGLNAPVDVSVSDDGFLITGWYISATVRSKSFLWKVRVFPKPRFITGVVFSFPALRCTFSI